MALDARKVEAAVLVAEGEKKRSEIAEAVGISERQLYEWLRDKEFQAEVERSLRQLTRELLPAAARRLRQNIEKADDRDANTAIQLAFKVTGWLDRLENEAAGTVKHVLVLPAKTDDWRGLANGNGTVRPPDE